MYTLHVAANPDELAEVIAEIKRGGHYVECAALDGLMARRERDSYLRMAHGLMPGPTCWAKCCQLEKEISTFETIQWPRLRDHDAPPESCSMLRRHLFEARRLGPLPSTPRQIWNIAMKRGGRGDFKDKRL